MFRQINVHPDDWKYQRILWLDKQHRITPYELTTVTYGTRAAPFLAGRVLNQLILDEGDNYPLAVEPMTRGQYVDDISGGADDPDQLKQISQQLIKLCNAGGFPLAKWKSNHRPGTQNPANCASRGLTSSQLLDHPLCWHGPPWLASEKSHWPIISQRNNVSVLQE